MKVFIGFALSSKLIYKLQKKKKKKEGGSNHIKELGGLFECWNKLSLNNLCDTSFLFFF